MPPEWKYLRAALPRLALLYDLACFYYPLPLCLSRGSAAYFPSTASLHNAASTAMPHSVISLPPSSRHTRLTVVRRGCEWYRIVGVHGEAMYTALTLRSACSHSSCKLPMCGVKGQGPLPFSGGSKGGILFGKRIPPLFAPAACRRHLTFPFKGRKRRKAPCMNTFM